MDQEKRAENIRRLADLLQDFQVAMLTTLQARDGSLHSRPMLTQKEPTDGSLWFFSKANTALVEDVRGGSQVNLSYCDSNQQRYIAVSGSAYVIRERMRMEELWQDEYLTWFPRGLDEPDLVLLRVEIATAEVWELASSENSILLQFI